jgi:hypothetical protein
MQIIQKRRFIVPAGYSLGYFNNEPACWAQGVGSENFPLPRATGVIFIFVEGSRK